LPLKPQGEGEARPRQTSKLTKVDAAVAEAPPRPRFDSRDIIKQSQMHGNGLKRPRIVVPVNEARRAPILPPRPVAQRAQVQAAATPNARPVDGFVPAPQYQPGRRSLRALYAFLIILAFAGILLATHFYVSRQRAITSTPAGNTASPDVGREGMITTDVKLRPDPSINNRAIGIVTQGSRARVLTIDSNWCEIEVIQQGRDDPNSANRGWINRKYLNID
jgi:hypothetical protein